MSYGEDFVSKSEILGHYIKSDIASYWLEILIYRNTLRAIQEIANQIYIAKGCILIWLRT